MDSTESINNAISTELPDPKYRSTIERLAEMVNRILSGTLPSAQAQDLVSSDTSVHQLIKLLAGKQLSTKDSILYFGDQSNVGDVTINDLAGQNIIKLTFNVYNTSQGKAYEEYIPQGKVLTDDEKRFFQLFTLHAGEQSLGKSFSLIRSGKRKYLRRGDIEMVVELRDRQLIDLARKGFIKIYVSSNPTSIVVQTDFLTAFARESG